MDEHLQMIHRRTCLQERESEALAVSVKFRSLRFRRPLRHSTGMFHVQASVHAVWERNWSIEFPHQTRFEAEPRTEERDHWSVRLLPAHDYLVHTWHREHTCCQRFKCFIRVWVKCKKFQSIVRRIQDFIGNEYLRKGRSLETCSSDIKSNHLTWMYCSRICFRRRMTSGFMLSIGMGTARNNSSNSIEQRDALLPMSKRAARTETVSASDRILLQSFV